MEEVTSNGFSFIFYKAGAGHDIADIFHASLFHDEAAIDFSVINGCFH